MKNICWLSSANRGAEFGHLQNYIFVLMKIIMRAHFQTSDWRFLNRRKNAFMNKCLTSSCSKAQGFDGCYRNFINEICK